LVELLVVVSIIAVLISLMMPLAAKALVSARAAKTHAILKDLGFALQAFKRDFGAYPPSTVALPGTLGLPSPKTHTNATTSYTSTQLYGNECLYLYLLGPSNSGWGSQAGGRKPLGGVSDRAYGPYYQGGPSMFGMNIAEDKYDTILDAFPEVRRPIFYFLRRDGDFDVTDCPVYDKTRAGSYGFGNQELFEQQVLESADAASLEYLLISPGEDRCYGLVIRDTDSSTGRLELRPPIETDDDLTTCELDDITNF